MYSSPNRLPEGDRARIAASLNDRLVDAIDLHTQLKVAHWNIKGPTFAALHPLFDTFAAGLLLWVDVIAERAVTLGWHVQGTARHVAAHSRIPEYPADARRDIDHVRLCVERFDVMLSGLRTSRFLAEEHDDAETIDILTGAAAEIEKNAWFLRATLDGG